MRGAPLTTLPGLLSGSRYRDSQFTSLLGPLKWSTVIAQHCDMVARLDWYWLIDHDLVTRLYQ